MIYLSLSNTAGADYEAVSTVLTFAPGDRRQCVNVTIIDDDIVEPTEVFTCEATLDLLTPIAGVSIGSGGNATVTITDEDGE